MNARRMVATLAVVVLSCMILLGCADSDLQKGTYVGWEATLEGDDTPRYMIELEDGTKILAAGEEAPEEGEEVRVRQLEDDTWEIVPDE